MYANETRTASTSKVNPKSKSQVINSYLRGFKNIPEMEAILEMKLTDFFKFVEDPKNNVYKKFYDRVYKEAGGQEETIKKGTPLGEDGKPIFNEFGKVMKGPNYFKPDLGKFLRK